MKVKGNKCYFKKLLNHDWTQFTLEGPADDASCAHLFKCALRHLSLTTVRELESNTYLIFCSELVWSN